MQTLMRDRQFPEAERVVQPMFRKSSLFNGFALAVLVLAMAAWLRLNRPPIDLSPAIVAMRWDPLALPPIQSPRARIAGAWVLVADDPRVGGFSGLAVDGERLLALSDSAMLVWLPRPGDGSHAEIRPLPAAAGNIRTKVGRDSEAIVRAGESWWVAFEQRHELVRFDRGLHNADRRIRLGERYFRPNRGVEALSAASGLVAYPERSGVSDAADLPDGPVALLKRGFGIGGFTGTIVGILDKPVRLPLGRLDNAEGIAAERNGRGTRLWVVTDNDNRPWRRTLLLAIDVPPAGD